MAKQRPTASNSIVAMAVLACSDCIFWGRKTETLGRCRRHAPVATPRGSPVFPVTGSGGWCGDHVSRTNPEGVL